MTDDQDEPAAEASAEAVAVAEERAAELAALAQVQDDLSDVDRALAALDDGTYGTCQVCGEALPDELLAESPVARLCAAHATAADGVREPR